MFMFTSTAQATSVAREARHAYRVAKMAGDVQGMKAADTRHRFALNFIRHNIT